MLLDGIAVMKAKIGFGVPGSCPRTWQIEILKFGNHQRLLASERTEKHEISDFGLRDIHVKDN